MEGLCCCLSSLCGALAGGPAHNPQRKETTNPSLCRSPFHSLSAPPQSFNLFFNKEKKRKDCWLRENGNGAAPLRASCFASAKAQEFSILFTFLQLCIRLAAHCSSTSNSIQSSHSQREDWNWICCVDWAGRGTKVSANKATIVFMNSINFINSIHFVNFMLYSPQLLYPCTVIILFYSTQWNQSNLISLNQIKKKFNFFCFVRWNGVKIDLFAASSIKN